ncbi:MAG: leucine-rich repeat protein [Clostridia bacterium]|nr:leucine-rich repeat protein [Clostridia bacterium]
MKSSMLKKTFSVFIAAALLLAPLPTGIVSVSSAAVSSGKCGDNLYWILDGTELSIVGTGDMWDCGYEETPPWYPDVETAVISEGVTSIGERAFNYCYSLTSVTIPDSVTSIGESAFNYCESLTSVTIPDGVTYIDERTFSECYNLESITFGSSVTSIAYRAFWCCSSLTGITLPESVISIDECAFLDCSLNDVSIPKNVSYIGCGAFSGCDVETLTVDPQNPVYHSAGNCIIETDEKCLAVGCKNSVIPSDGSVTIIGDSAFADCTGLTSVTIPSSVTSIGWGAFSGCTRASVTIGSGVTSIASEALGDCASITVDPDNPVLHSDGNCVINTREKKLIAGCRASVIPADGSVTAIAWNAFYGVEELNYIVVPKSVTNIESEYAFYHNYGYATLCVYKNSYAHLWAQSNGVPFELITDQSGKCGDNLFWSAEGFTLSIVGTGDMYDYSYWGNRSPFPKYVNQVNISDGVTSIGDYALYNCTGLTSITIPDGVTSVGEGAFEDCTGLTSVTIPDSVTSIGNWAFEDCTGLTSVTIPDSVTEIGYGAFSGCTGLTSVTIPNSVTSIGGYAFYGCTGLTSVTIGNGATSIGDYAFEDCAGLSSVVIPDSVTSIGYSAFRDCTGLTSVTLPDSVTSICAGAFHNTGYYNDKSNWENGVLYIGNWLIGAKKDISGDYTTRNGTVGIAGSAFSGCGNITGVTIGGSVTSIVYSAFSGCTSLADVTLPDSVKSIDSGAFYNTGYYNNESNWENDVLYIGNWLIEARDGISGSYNINEGTVGVAGEAFAWCDELTSVTIPNGVTSIGGRAFGYCAGLTSVTIPKSVTFIGYDAFHNYYWSPESGWTTHCPTLSVYNNSYAHRYAVYNGIPFELIEPSITKGDPDGDGEITVGDALIALRIAAKLVTPGENDYYTCDVDGDGEITVGDALSILRVAAKLADSL